MKFNNLESIPLEDFFEAYYQCRKRKRNTTNALLFEVNYEENLVKLWKEVNSRQYEIGKSICFLVTRPKLREVFAADFRDRIVHHLVMMRLEPLFEEVFIEDNYNCRKNKGTLYGVKRLHEQIKECSNNYTENCYIGKFDMQGFFMSINKEVLWNMLKNFITTKYHKKDKNILLWLVEKIVKHCPHYNCIRKTSIEMWNNLPKNKSLFTCGDDCGLPIGNLTSQCFANFYLHWFDLYMKKNFEYYGRYVDDFYVVSKDKSKITKFIPKITYYLKSNLNVSLHPKKIYIQNYKRGVKFIGAIVKDGRMYISNSTVSNAYIVIHKFNKLISKDNVEHFVQSLNSYWGFLKYYKTYNIKKRLLKLVNQNWFNYLTYIKNSNKFLLNEKYKTNLIIKKNYKKKKMFNYIYFN